MSKYCLQSDEKNFATTDMGRREFLGGAVKTSFGYIMAPTLFGLLLNKKALAEGVVYPRVVHITFFCRGGVSMFAEFMTKLPNGNNLLAYGTQGVRVANPLNTPGSFNEFLGTTMWNTALYQNWVAAPAADGVNATPANGLTASARAEWKTGIYYGQSNDDIGSSFKSITRVAAKANATVRQMAVAGMVNSFNGSGEYLPDAAFTPATIRNLASYQGLFVPNQGSLSAINPTVFEAVAKAARKMSDSQIERNLASKVASKEQLEELTGKGLTEAEVRFQAAATPPDPRQDVRLTRHIPGLAGAADTSPLFFLAAGLQAILNGKTSAMFMNLPISYINPANGQTINSRNGWDYHNQTVDYNGATNPAWVGLHEQVLAPYVKYAMNVLSEGFKGVQGAPAGIAIDIASDGSHTMGQQVNGIPQATADAGEKTINVSFYRRTDGVALQRSQLGGYSTAEAVDRNASLIAANVDTMAAARLVTLCDMGGINTANILSDTTLRLLSLYTR